MGFFKSLSEVQQQAREIEKTYDGKSMRANALDRMQQTTQMMADQTAAATISATGIEASATVVAAAQTGGMINMQPVLDIELTVMAPGQPPYPLQIQRAVDIVLAGRLTPGATLRVKVDPRDRQSLWIDPTS